MFFECENCEQSLCLSRYLISLLVFYYIVTTVYEGKERVVGFFSKEKDSEENNLACIIVFPPYQKQGFGRLLIQFSKYRRVIFLLDLVLLWISADTTVRL